MTKQTLLAGLLEIATELIDRADRDAIHHDNIAAATRRLHQAQIVREAIKQLEASQ